MNGFDLKKYFLDQLTNGDCYIEVGAGKARYKMSRGSFKTHDSIQERHHLVYQKQYQGEYLFADNLVSCRLTLEESQDGFKLHFDTESEFNRFLIRFKTFKDEHIYGCGEQYTQLDLKGEKVEIWVSEHQQVLKIAKKFLREKIHGVNPDYQAPYSEHQTYYSSPGFTSSKNYFVYCHEDSYGQLVFNEEEMILKFRQVPTSISFLTADSATELSQKVCRMVGIQPKLPSFVGDGLILAVQGGTEKVLKAYQDAKEAGVKIVALWCQDWSGQIVTEFGSQVYWNWELDSKLYHDFPKLLEALNKDGVKFLGYINTFVKENAEQYKYAKEKGYLVKKRDGSVYLIQSTTFNAGIVDLTNPAAYEWYKDLIKKNMIGVGLSGWMADFGEYLPTDSVVYGGKAEKLHNKWPTLWAKCNYDAVHELHKENEIFYFSRAAYGHTTQYTTSMWNGDQHVDYSDEYGLGSVIPAMLSMSLSGVGVNHSDVGGYTTVLHMKRDLELLVRWSELNVFTPVYRTHEGNRPKANVQAYQKEALPYFKENARRFAELKFYRDEVLEQYYENAIPTVRPLFFAFDEPKAYTDRREFMFGDELIVTPVLRKERENQHVYLPKGEWIQLYSGKHYQSNGAEKVFIDTPLGMPVAFYRPGCKHEAEFALLK